ncbi:MAG: acyltransferase [Acidimicrobiia bacterium]|nr:acyltransferase [Acidimicrobiia bacterium]
MAGARDHHDAFDTLRVLAALVVVFWHAYPLTGHPHPVIPLLGRSGTTYGALAVGAFFAMSGYLVTASWRRRPAADRFVRARAGRIFPGLVVCILLTALVLGPLVTASAGYFSEGEEVSGYVVHGATLFRIQEELPGVFLDNPYPAIVNGSLWSLPYEFVAYLAVLVLGTLGVLRSRWSGLAAVGVLGAAFVWLQARGAPHLLDRGTAWFGLNLYDGVHVGLFFAVGMASLPAYEAIRRHRALTVGLGALVVLAASLAEVRVGQTVGFSMVVVAVGTASWRPARELRRLGDPSYGAYIYAFPIQQLLAGAGIGSPVTMFVLAAPLALLAGYASWHLVERRFVVRSRAREPDAVGVPS